MTSADRGVGFTKQGADPHYHTMSHDAIKSLPVGHLARGDGILLLWSTGAMLPQALDVLDAWGTKHLSQIIWRKVTKNGKVRVGTGYRCAPLMSRSSWRASAAGRSTRRFPRSSAAWPRAFPEA
jgi:hypothetical protein